MLEPLKICTFYIDWYWVIIAPTSVLALALFVFNLKKRLVNISSFKALIIGVTIISSGFWGAKVASAFELYLMLGVAPSIDTLGSRLYGSIIAGLLSCMLLARLFQVNDVLKILDSLAITTAVCFAIGKIGCFLSGHPGCYGVPTSLPWGIEFAYNGKSIGYLAHPVQLYDSAFYFITYVMTVYFAKHINSEGSVFMLFILLISGYSILIEFIRDNHAVIGKFTLAQTTYTIILFVSLVLLYKEHFFGKKSKV